MRKFKIFSIIGIVFLSLTACFLLSACDRTSSGNGDVNGSSDSNDKNNSEAEYMHITAEEAKKIMDTEDDYVILDVRTEDEFADGHIPGAVLIPDYEIADTAEEKLTDKEQTILVYCRSGRRSKNAAEALAGLGYTNVKEFGGIIDWPYETVSE